MLLLGQLQALEELRHARIELEGIALSLHLVGGALDRTEHLRQLLACDARLDQVASHGALPVVRPALAARAQGAQHDLGLLTRDLARLDSLAKTLADRVVVRLVCMCQTERQDHDQSHECEGLEPARNRQHALRVDDHLQSPFQGAAVVDAACKGRRADRRSGQGFHHGEQGARVRARARSERCEHEGVAAQFLRDPEIAACNPDERIPPQ